MLIVDDNIDTAQGLARLLRRAGHEVTLAHDGHHALQASQGIYAGRRRVLDIGLPGMDGFEVVRRLRAEDWCANSVVIAVTGYGQPEDRQRAMEAGFDHHLVKPVDLEELKQSCKSAAQRTEARLLYFTFADPLAARHTFRMWNGAIEEFAVRGGCAQKQRTTTHIAASGELFGKQQTLSQNRQKGVEIFARRDTPEQDDVIGSGGEETFGSTAQWGSESRLARIDGHRGKLRQFPRADVGIGREQAPTRRDDPHLPRRLRKVAGVGEFSAEVEPAAKREDLTQRGGSDLHLTRQLETRARPGEHGRALSTRVRR